MYGQLRVGGRRDGRKGALSERTILHVHRVLSEALEQAVAWQILPRNVCRSVDAPRAKRAEIVALGPQESRRLMEVAEGENSPYASAVFLALHTGLRLGEVLGLSWEDIDVDRGELVVRQALQQLHHGQEATLKGLKTQSSRRTIPLGESVLRLLRRVRKQQLEARLSAGSAYQESGLVLTTSLGTPLSASNVRRMLHVLSRKAEVPNIRFHDLRHTHASLMLARDVHPKIVSERLGHSSIGLTMDTYSHVLPNLQREAVRDFDEWLSRQKA